MRVKRAVISVLLAAVLFVMPVSALSESVDFGSIDTPVATHLSSTADGWLDSVSITEIRGWAWNSATPNSPIDVHVYVINTTLNREWSYAVTADQYRADLDVAGYGNGYHGFSYLINWYNYPAGDYLIRVYGMDGVTNPQLSGCPGTFSIASPTGSGDYLGSDGIRGWAWKPISPDFPIQVHIYVRNMSGQVLNNIVLTADEYRADLQAAGYGNGNHGFSTSINWSDYPEEKLQVTVYAVDGTGYHPAIFNEVYDNRTPIRLLGMKDDQSGGNFSTAFDDYGNYRTYCDNIGCSSLRILNQACKSQLFSYIKDSSYLVIFTHGNKFGIGYNSVENPADSDGLYSIDDLYDIPDNYFKRTRCVLLVACSTAKGGAGEENFANVLHAKGVKTVVGFKTNIRYAYSVNDKGRVRILDTWGAGLWCKLFTQYLGEGYSVAGAISRISTESTAENGLVGNGFENWHIAGDMNQIIKH